jgi:hypothetical protein
LLQTLVSGLDLVHNDNNFKTNKMKLAKISTLQTEELACYITGLDYDEIDANEEIIDEKLQEEFGCDLQQFTVIIQRLLPLIDVGSSPLTQKRYKGFSDIENGMWFVKIEVGS